ncbi:MAG: hypothetical protein COB22_06420 [Cycloclasticus sp.]|nr:MAG: hypothetical protein COB22_06420 [Cycloclasticus sp.]
MLKHPINKSRLSGLQNIQQHLLQQHQLLKVVNSALPNNLSEHCLHATYYKNNLTLYTNSSVWASKLLYMRAPILNAISKSVGDRVTTLHVKVLSKKHSLETYKTPKSPSNKSIQFLCNANKPKHADKLSVAMNKLINTLQKNKLSN